MPLYQKGLQSRKRQKNRAAIYRKMTSSINAYSEALERFEHIANQIIFQTNSLANVPNILNIIPSNMNALMYKLEDVTRQIQDIGQNIQSVHGMSYMLSPVTSEIQRFNTDLRNHYNDFLNELLKFRGEFQNLDKIINDPVMTRTIDEIREISNRYDSILE